MGDRSLSRSRLGLPVAAVISFMALEYGSRQAVNFFMSP